MKLTLKRHFSHTESNYSPTFKRSASFFKSSEPTFCELPQLLLPPSLGILFETKQLFFVASLETSYIYRISMWGGSRSRGNAVFESDYAVFSMAMSGKSTTDEGDKILLPNSAWDQLARMEVTYPMMFEIRNDQLGKITHCGVREFTADEGKCHMPFTMMQNLFLEEGSLVTIKNVTLKKAKFLKFRAQSVDFLDITNHRAVLEHALRSYSCCTTGDMISLAYAGKIYELEVTEVKPDGKACIIETDCEVDFDAPVGYVDPSLKKAAAATNGGSSAGAQGGKAGGGAAASADSNVGTAFPARAVQRAKLPPTDASASGGGVFAAFTGAPNRIDGKPLASERAGAGAGPSVNPREAALKAAQARADAEAAAEAAKLAADSSAPQRKSRLGDKFSVKKANAAAFSGGGAKLN
jgi:ubiquitin fusion degradation protein 1